ncbi:MAG: DUF2290 domain-containing protein [Planctomycetes bacterium]|nr:DUF2290 domain-containing protein [Planctomycetota bacterium]
MINFVDSMFTAEIAIDFTYPCLEASHGVERLTWPAIGVPIAGVAPFTSATLSEFRSWVSCRGYTALLLDGGFLQVSVDVVGKEVIGHRYVYFPPPFDFDRGLLAELPLIEVVDDYCLNAGDCVRLRSPIRFDFAPSKTKLEPDAHLTTLWSHCRIPVCAPLSLGHFVRFVFRNFYPELWEAHEFIREWPVTRFGRCLAASDEGHLHVNWLDRSIGRALVE